MKPHTIACLTFALPLAGAVLLGVARAQPPAGEKVALLVGVTQYNHSKLDNLKFTERDVEEFAKVLTANGFSKVVVLTHGRGGKLTPTLANIRRELDALLERRGKKDLVVVGLSGHGLQLDGEKDSFFCPFDANPTKKESLLSLARVYRDLDDSGAGAKMLFVDACRDDPAGKGVKGVDGDNLPAATKGMAVLFSCSPKERSFEHAAWKHGAFFASVLEGLRPDGTGQRLAADADGDGIVDVAELARFVGKAVPDRVKRTIDESAEQTPHELINGTSRVVLARFASAGPPRPDPEPTQIVAKSAAGLRLVRIEPGSFLMGSPDSEKGEDDERPRHRVKITRAFYLGLTEVTVKQFRAFVQDTSPAYRTDAELAGDSYTWSKPYVKQEDDHPVIHVSWNDADAFCKWLSKKEERTFRLPAEAEWEYACRAGTDTEYHGGSGEVELKKIGWYSGNSKSSTQPVGKLAANPWGLHDMHGNVWEWCSGDRRPYRKEDIDDPEDEKTSDRRVLRGGSWYYGPRSCRAAACLRLERTERNSNVGFRVACSSAGGVR